MYIHFCAVKVVSIVTNMSLAWLWEWLWTIADIFDYRHVGDSHYNVQ